MTASEAEETETSGQQCERRWLRRVIQRLGQGGVIHTLQHAREQ